MQIWANTRLYVALLVAFIKATLVALYFMHLPGYDRPFNAIIFVGCLILVTLFISFSMTDSGAYRTTVVGGQAKSVPLHDLSEGGETRARAAQKVAVMPG